MKNYHVLVVDDDEVFLMLTTKFLQKIEFDSNLQKFKNGAEALTYFEEEYNQQDIFVILLDINMPVMDGWEFLNALKRKAYKRNTLVYMVTSSTDIKDKEKSETYSIVRGYESKPLTADKLEVIKKELFSSYLK